MRTQEIKDRWSDVSDEGWIDPILIERRLDNRSAILMLHRNRDGQAIVYHDVTSTPGNSLRMLMGDETQEGTVEVLDSAGDIRLYLRKFAVPFELALQAASYFLETASPDPSLKWGDYEEADPDYF